MGAEPTFRVAVDAMGSDNHPGPEVLGVVQALKQYPGTQAILVGDRKVIEQHLQEVPAAGLPLEIVHTDECIGMSEHPVMAIRKKKNNSMRLAMNLIKEGRADGFITAGNTGAGMTLAKLVLGACRGVDRPALATVVPSIKGTTIIVDVGANVDCKPLHLEQFAIMGHVYAKMIFGIEKPRVALLSIGEEEIKGNDLIKEVHQALKHAQLNFVGNIEGRDVYVGDVDVVVCDGFVGNVALKISEGVIAAIMHLLKKELASGLPTQVGALLTRPAFRKLKKKIDYSEYGGAPLLGVRSPVIIGHGRSNANAIKNAIRVVREFHLHQLSSKIEQEIELFMQENRRREV